MATLDQLYRAYLSGDPNVDKMVYDPFGWNYEQTFDTTEEDTDTGIGAVVSPTTTGGDNYSVYNPDPNKIRLPDTYRETPGLTAAGDQWLANQQLAEMGIDNPWESEAGLRIPYDAPDASQYADVFADTDLINKYKQFNPGKYDNLTAKEMYDLGLPGLEKSNISNIFPDYVSPGYDEEYDVDLEPGQQTWFNKMKSGLRDNPLMQGVMTAINPAMMVGKNILQGMSRAFPVSERAILENEALGSGIALDDIGRVVYRDYGKDPRTGEWGALDYDTPENVMAGYSYAQLTEDTFDKRIKNIKIKDKDARAKRIKAIEEAKRIWLLNKQKTDWVTQQKKLDRATDDQKTTIEDFKTKENILEDDIFDQVSTTTPKDDIIVPKAKPKVIAKHSPHQHHHDDDRGGPQPDKGDWGGYEDRAHGEFNHGGRVGYGKGGIVDLL